MVPSMPLERVTVTVTVGTCSSAKKKLLSNWTTPGLGPPTIAQGENSDVSLVELVAVALINWPAGVTGKVELITALPFASVVMLAKPMKVSPSPKPEPLQAELAKNSIRNWL